MFSAAFAITAMTAPAAFAQSAEAEQLFQEGDRLMAEGKTSEACTAFEGSNRIEARAGTLIRLGECREKNKQLASAWSAYTDALSRAKDPKKRDAAQKGVKSVEGRLSRLTINVSPAAKVAGLSISRDGKPVDEVLWNRAIPVDGGEYTIVAKAPGMTDATVKASVPAEKGAVTSEIPKLEPAPVATDPNLNVGAVGAGPKTEDTAIVGPVDTGERPSSFTGTRKLAVGIGVVGLAAIGVGAVFGKQAKDGEDEALELCNGSPTTCPDAPTAKEAQSLNDDAKSKATLSNVMFGVGGAAVVGAVVLWVIGGPKESSTVSSIVPTVTDREVGLAFGGRF